MLIGNTGNLMRLINLFHSEVARHYGLSKRDKSSLNAKDKHSIERQVLTRLANDNVMLSCVWACVRDAIHKDPMPWAQMLSIEPVKLTRKTNKSFVDIKCSTGKGSFVT